MVSLITGDWKDPTDWVLAINIDPSDGHNFGWGAAAWSGGVAVGNQEESLLKDFLDPTAYSMAATHIAIARHNGTVMEAVKVWKLSSQNSLEQYLKPTNPGRQIGTVGGHIQYDHISNLKISSKDGGKDPIFGVDGNIAFNWWYSNNGARICLDGGHLSEPGVNDDGTHGLGNEFGANTQNGEGSSKWWHDVANIKDCHGGSCDVQGTDHGTSLSSGEKLGQYAIFVSNISNNFPVKNLG